MHQDGHSSINSDRAQGVCRQVWYIHEVKGEHKALRIGTSNGESLVVTPHHLLSTEYKGFSAASSVQVGDSLQGAKGLVQVCAHLILIIQTSRLVIFIETQIGESCTHSAMSRWHAALLTAGLMWHFLKLRCVLQVVSIDTVKAAVRSPITMSGTIMVNGVLASCYGAGESNHTASQQ